MNGETKQTAGGFQFNKQNEWAASQNASQTQARMRNDREWCKRIGEHNDRAYRTDAYSQACIITRWLLGPPVSMAS